MFADRGLRGSGLEEIINITNEVYLKNGLAIIQKIPTPITPIEIDKETRHITLAYFDKKSTVDYIGAVQGIPICFDAKETANKSLPLQNIHPHQIEFMEKFMQQEGVSFLLVHFLEFDEYYFLPFEVLKKYVDAAAEGGRKSIPYSAFEKKYQIKNEKGYICHYLEALNVYITGK
ncbi:MAG: Holliday junction resolvase RecU [Firmicutes bacterium]|nr:Holliday junction resolvase RecU [Bacillota bacterium]